MELNDLESLKKDLKVEEGQKVTEVNLLFLDLSSSCTGYTLVSVNFENKVANFLNAGAIWFDDSWNNQDKYHYIYNTLVNYFNIVGQIDFCFMEAYMINPKKKMGCMVGPELHGATAVALAEIGVKYRTVPVGTWRKALGVKKDPVTGDFKEPTKKAVEFYHKLPTTIRSNITGNQRQLPNDVSDALGIAIGVLKNLGFTKLLFSSLKIQENLNIG